MLKRLALISTAVIAALVAGAGPAGAANHGGTQHCHGILVAAEAGAPVNEGRGIHCKVEDFHL